MDPEGVLRDSRLIPRPSIVRTDLGDAEGMTSFHPAANREVERRSARSQVRENRIRAARETLPPFHERNELPCRRRARGYLRVPEQGVFPAEDCVSKRPLRPED